MQFVMYRKKMAIEYCERIRIFVDDDDVNSILLWEENIYHY